MKLFERAIIKETGQAGVLVDDGTVNGRHYFIIEIDNDEDDTLPCHWDEELEPEK